MSEENIRIVRDGYEAFNRGDIEAIVATLDPGIEWWPASDEPIVEPYRGHDGYRALVGEIREYVPDLQADVEEVFAVDGPGGHLPPILGSRQGQRRARRGSRNERRPLPRRQDRRGPRVPREGRGPRITRSVRSGSRFPETRIT